MSMCDLYNAAHWLSQFRTNEHSEELKYHYDISGNVNSAYVRTLIQLAIYSSE